eukprot:420706-Prymnesium_polylepis.1
MLLVQQRRHAPFSGDGTHRREMSAPARGGDTKPRNAPATLPETPRPRPPKRPGQGHRSAVQFTRFNSHGGAEIRSAARGARRAVVGAEIRAQRTEVRGARLLTVARRCFFLR